MLAFQYMGTFWSGTMPLDIIAAWPGIIAGACG
jgi:hypothetical protein